MLRQTRHWPSRAPRLAPCLALGAPEPAPSSNLRGGFAPPHPPVGSRAPPMPPPTAALFGGGGQQAKPLPMHPQDSPRTVPCLPRPRTYECLQPSLGSSYCTRGWGVGGGGFFHRGREAGQGASIGQVWTRHLAPAAPASRPSSPTQFHVCPCHADSALQFVPSLLPGWGKSRAASTGFRALSPSG